MLNFEGVPPFNLTIDIPKMTDFHVCLKPTFGPIARLDPGKERHGKPNQPTVLGFRVLQKTTDDMVLKPWQKIKGFCS